MAVADQIHHHVQKLPEPLQIEVLDFVEYLLSKITATDDDEAGWDTLSLSAAMRGMEDEPTPVYDATDLKQVFAT